MGRAAQLIEVRPVRAEDRALVTEYWGSEVVRRGESIEIDGLPGFVA